MRRKRILTGAILLALGCGQGGERSPAEQGQRIYVANCTACHNPSPMVDGTLGPAVAGSSRELIEARVLHAEYPPGYTPQRPTQQMVAMPYLEPYIEVLAAYLAEP